MRVTKSGQILFALAGLGAAEAQAAGPSDATVTVIHGITGQDLGLAPELPVDVEVSGQCVLTSFTFGSISPRLDLPPGSYDIRVRLSDGACGGAVAVEALGVPFAADENATVIAHLDASGGPTASKFTNDLTPSAAHQGRVVAHHTAAAPAVDVRLRRPGVFVELAGVVNGQSGGVELDAKKHTLLIAPAGGRPIFREVFRVFAGKTVFAYAVGSVSGGTFAILFDVQAQAQPVPPADVTIIHGITGQDLGLSPELPVDISIAGIGCVATDVRFGAIASGFQLPAGAYDIEIRLSDGACTGAVAVSAAGVPFSAGEDATVIAHLDENGGPTASKFTNDVSKLSRRKDRFVVHHVAAAPAVDVALSTFFGRRPLELKGVVNGQSGGEEVRRGLYIFSVAPAGGSPIFRAFAPLFGGDLILVYAVGSVSTGTFQLIAERRSL